jgi:hypothetical protein
VKRSARFVGSRGDGAAHRFIGSIIAPTTPFFVLTDPEDAGPSEESATAGRMMRLPVMRLVTYDRGGARRLGAWVEDEVVDLPDAVGHPVFPTTLEGFVARNGGTTLDAARHALGRPGVLAECAVAEARLLTPLLPLDPVLPVLDPEAEVPWPEPAEVLRPGPHLACIVGKPGRNVPVDKAASVIFGYTLINIWSAYGGRRRRFAESIGPSVVTSEEFDPSGAELICRVDGGVWSKGTISRDAFAANIAELSSAERGLGPGDLIIAPFGSARGPRIGLTAGPGSVVEVEAEGIGVLRNRLGARHTGAVVAKSSANTSANTSAKTSA